MDGLDKDVSKRFKSLGLDKIDSEFLASDLVSKWKQANDYRDDFLSKREDWTQNWRDLNTQRREGPWENSSNFNVPITLYYGKSVHARLWQLFSDMSKFFGVKARKEAFQEKEAAVQEFMQFILTSWCNGKEGVEDVFDEWLWNVVFDGCEYLKLYWQKDVHKFVDVVPVVDVTEKTVFDSENLTGRVETEIKQREEEKTKETIVESPHIKRVMLEDIVLPPGQSDPQKADFVIHRLFMTESDLKARAREGKFLKDSVEESLKHRGSYSSAGDQSIEIKRQRQEMDGVSDADAYFNNYHVVLECYTKAYVKKEITGEESKDIDEFPEEVVVWLHYGSMQILGWTYLHRISPSGIRPIFKGDFIRFPDRNTGVGVAEVLAPIQSALNAVYNLRQDSGILASTPWGGYRASSTLKPDKLRIEPGTFIPLDDPQTDLRIIQTPFLQGYGYQEEDRLVSYAERILNVSDIQLGRSPAKVGTFRTASGANVMQQESGIQLEIHFSRIARTLNKLLKALFILCRERMPENFYYRITGEGGRPIFGKVNRADLMGDFDFEINVDILGESRTEAQQKATMMMQTLINPAFMNTGVVTPDNLYHLAKNFLGKNRVTRSDNYISPPPQYQGEIVTPAERVYRIIVNNFMNPPVEETIKLNEDHEKAMAYYQSFQDSDQFGLLVSPEQLQALNRLKERHTQLLMAQQAGGNPNMSGMQVPREGFAPLEAGPGADQGTLGAPMGEVNGPVV